METSTSANANANVNAALNLSWSDAASKIATNVWSRIALSERDCVNFYRPTNASDPEYDASTRRLASTVCKINSAIWNVTPPLYLIVGTLGNILSIVVWSNRRLAQQTQFMSVVLVSLGVSDTFVLYTGLLLHYMRKSTYIGWNVQNEGSVICKVHEFLVYTSLSTSAWLVGLIALERCVTVVFWKSYLRGRLCGGSLERPRCGKGLQRPASLHLAIGLIVASCALVNVHILWTREFADLHCTNNRRHYSQFLDQVWPKVDLAFAAILPVSVVLLSTATIAATLYKANAKRLARQRCLQPEISSRSAPASLVSDCTSGHKMRPQSQVARRMNKVTCTLVCVSVCYIVCTCPAKVYLVVNPNVTPLGLAPLEYFKYRLLWTCMLTLQYLSNSVNFLIYSVANSLFREHLKLTVRKLCCRA